MGFRRAIIFLLIFSLSANAALAWPGAIRQKIRVTAPELFSDQAMVEPLASAEFRPANTPVHGRIVRRTAMARQAGKIRLREILVSSVLAVVIASGGTIVIRGITTASEGLAWIFLTTQKFLGEFPVLDTLSALVIISIALRGVYEYTRTDIFKRYTVPLKEVLLAHDDSDVFPLWTPKMIYGPLFVTGALIGAIFRPFPGFILLATVFLIGFHGSISKLGMYVISKQIGDPKKLLRITPEHIELLNAKPNEFNVKAIGYRYRLWPWKEQQNELVLWLREPYFLRWIGLASWIPAYIKPTEHWTPLSHKVRNRLPGFLRFVIPVRAAAPAGGHKHMTLWSA